LTDQFIFSTLYTDFVYFWQQSGQLDEGITINSSLQGENVRPNSHTESTLLEIENSSILIDKGDMRQKSELQTGRHARHGGGKENIQVWNTLLFLDTDS